MRRSWSGISDLLSVLPHRSRMSSLRKLKWLQTMRCASAGVDGAETIGNAINRRYILALSLIAGVMVVGGWLLGEMVGRQERHASIINLAGAQRMLSQRIALLATEVATGEAGLPSGPKAGVLLDAAIQRMGAAAERLTQVSLAPAHDTPALEEAYFGERYAVAVSVQKFLQQAKFVLDTARRNDLDAARAAGASLRAAALGPLLTTLHHAVGLHEKAAHDELHRTMWVHRGLVIVGLMLLVFEARLIFWPMSRRVGLLAGRLEHEASIDSLTGLLNRRAFNIRLRDLVRQTENNEQSGAERRHVSVLVVDLDWLKEANAAQGQSGGDALLRSAAAAMRSILRPGDPIGRLGGDEFAAAFIAIDPASAQSVAQRLRDAMHQPTMLKGRSLRAGASIGLASTSEGICDGDALLAAASDAMTMGKRTKRGSVTSFTEGDRTRLDRVMVLRRSFDRHAVGGLDGLCAHLQPQLRFADGSLVGFEALARWRHDQLGWVSPAEFLPLAQEYGCFDIVGSRVRRSALSTIAGLWANGHPWGAPPRVALNFSHAELAREDIVEILEQDLRDAGLPPSAIEIEITEEVLLDRVSELTRERLVNLRSRGARIALDDFGCGAAGLIQVLRLPLDSLKIDRSFVAEIGRDARAEQIIETTVLLAHGLGMSVTAEGVETPAQHEHLLALSCDVSQGYFHAPALGGIELASWLRTRLRVDDAAVPTICLVNGDNVHQLRSRRVH